MSLSLSLPFFHSHVVRAKIMCRSNTEIEQDIQQKIAMFCHVDPENVVGVHDCKSIYQVPLLLEKQGILFVCLWIIFCLKKANHFMCRLYHWAQAKAQAWPDPREPGKHVDSDQVARASPAVRVFLSVFFLPIHFHLATSGLWTRS